MILLQLFQAGRWQPLFTVPEDVLPPSERLGHFTGINPETPQHTWQRDSESRGIIKPPECVISVLYPTKSWLSIQAGADFRASDTENRDLS